MNMPAAPLRAGRQPPHEQFYLLDKLEIAWFGPALFP
jgi:hypothetical protein